VTWAGDVDFGPEAPLDGNLGEDYLAFKQRWITDALAGRRGGVHYFLMGGGSGRRDGAGRLSHGGRWRTAPTWPPPETRRETWFLHEDQTLQAVGPARPGRIAYDFDPRDPVPSRGGGITSGEPLMYGGAFDQTFETTSPSGISVLPLSARGDVVSFQTPPLTEPIAVVGSVVLELDLSSSAPDTDIAVTLVDVHPPSPDYPRGYAMNVTDGMLRVRYRNDPSRPVLMETGKVYRLEIALPDTANLFARDHRLRIDLTSSNFPRCDVNPNTGGAVMGARTWQVARNVIHTGRSALHVDVLRPYLLD
jgi:putative CocE/NonD family hydrolase